MKKINKKQKQIIGIVLAIILIAFFVQFKPLSIFSSQVNYGTNAKLISETSEYAIYRLDADLVSNEGGYVESKTFSNEFTARILSNGYVVQPVANLQTDVYFPSDNFKIDGLTGYCDYSGSDQQTDSSAYFKNQVAECKISNGKVVAKFSGDIGTTCTKNTAYKIKGDLFAECKILKQGIECLDDSYCEEKICQNNKCVEKQVNYYRLSNNLCSQITILSSEKTENDYSTINECQSKVIINPPTPEPTSWFSWITKLNEWISDFFRRIFG